ncbi:MAG: succinate--CoA ligase subunit alpha [Candidatus Hodarchaeota archaeon]
MLIDENTAVLVQGITGRQGRFHTDLMLEYGTNIVAGVTPGKGGQEVQEVPVYNKVSEALKEHQIDATIVFVPSKFAKDAVLENITNEIPVICIITEGIPVQDMLHLSWAARKKGAVLIGPNTPGMLIPEQIKLGIMPSDLCHHGNIAVITKSGTLSYEIVKTLDLSGFGVSSYVGIGGDPIRGTGFVKLLEIAETDPETKAIVLIGEIGGDEEERAAKYIQKSLSKPTLAYIAGKSAPKGKRMGHAGAIISGSSGTAQSKIKALKSAGTLIADSPWEIPKLIQTLDLED